MGARNRGLTLMEVVVALLLFALMATMMKYATPGEHHAHLKPLAGKWKFASKFRQVPDAPWNESGGESTTEWILGGRFLTQRVKSPATEAFPMDFEGFALLGYDNLAKEYLSIWADRHVAPRTSSGHRNEAIRPRSGSQRSKENGRRAGRPL